MSSSPDGARPSSPVVHVNIPQPPFLPTTDVRPSLDTDLLVRAVHETLAADGVSGEVSLTLVGDARIREMNRDYLGHDYVTDVLSFALHGDGEPVLADIYIGLDQARRQAHDLEVELEEELVRLAIHGTLHVLGHDHPDEERDDSPLFRRQEALVKRVLAAGVDTRQDPPDPA